MCAGAPDVVQMKIHAATRVPRYVDAATQYQPRLSVSIHVDAASRPQSIPDCSFSYIFNVQFWKRVSMSNENQKSKRYIFVHV